MREENLSYENIVIDTCILSEVRHPSGNTAVKKALSSYEGDNLFLSVLTLGEIAKGIFLLPSSLKKTVLLIGSTA